ncbi:MAG: hypothetical protein AB7O59_10465 [Pirellulales bacterium]
MEFDRANISICERSWTDNLDLALQAIRRYGGPLAICSLALVVPFAVLNHFIIFALFPEPQTDEAPGGVLYWITCLVLIEAPLATAPITLYLGQALFVEKPAAQQVVRGLVACLPQLVLLQLIMRTLLILPVVTWVIPYAIAPYLNEVILLERNPLVGRHGQISTLKRSSQLHRGNSGEYSGRATAAALISVLLITAIYLTEDVLVRNLLGFEPGPTGWLIEMQVAFWLVAIYFAVVRFLTYLDGRIRNEGWEVELLLRAERARLMRPIV